MFNKTAVLAAALFFAGVSAQGQAGITECIGKCLQAGVSDGTCSSLTDVSCFCTNTDFQSAFAACIQSDCPDELDAAQALQGSQCGGTSASESGAPSGSATGSGSAGPSASGSGSASAPSGSATAPPSGSPSPRPSNTSSGSGTPSGGSPSNSGNAGSPSNSDGAALAVAPGAGMFWAAGVSVIGAVVGAGALL